MHFWLWHKLGSLKGTLISSGSILLDDSSQHSLVPISDESGVIIHSTMNFIHVLFGTMVHLYLMLLLIDSVPGSSSTKVIIKRSNNTNRDSETDSYTGNDYLRQYSDSDSVGRLETKYATLRSSDLAGLEVARDATSKKLQNDRTPELINCSSLNKHANANKSTISWKTRNSRFQKQIIWKMTSKCQEWKKLSAVLCGGQID